MIFFLRGVIFVSIFSERLSLLIKQAGITQARFAADLGITPQAASYYTKGREPSFELLIKIADYFHVTTDYLIGASKNGSVSISNYGDAVNVLLAMIDRGLLTFSIDEPVKGCHNINFSITNHECIEFFSEYSQMMKLLSNGSISESTFGTWLGAGLTKLQNIPLPTQFLWKDGEWIIKD